MKSADRNPTTKFATQIANLLAQGSPKNLCAVARQTVFEKILAF